MELSEKQLILFKHWYRIGREKKNYMSELDKWYRHIALLLLLFCSKL
jgi:hypothetical protein